MDTRSDTHHPNAHPDARKHTPQPIIDNLESIGNPFKRNAFSAAAYLSNDAKFIRSPESGSSHPADLDLEYTLKFLYQYNGSSATFNAYRRELERLLQWAWNIEHKTAIALKREDIEDFARFCVAPPLPWIGTKNVARYKVIKGERQANPDWRPFVVGRNSIPPDRPAETRDYSCSQTALKAMFTTLSSFYDYLLQEGLIEANPVSMIRQKSKFIQKEQSAAPVRRITNLQWDYLVETAEMMAKENPAQHERTLFIINCLFAMYLRISELVADERSTPVMGDFQKDQDDNWWFHVTGKGNKNRRITVCDEMLEALKRYRRARALSPLPARGDNTPLIPSSTASTPISSTRHIRRIVQSCFDAAYARMVSDGLEEDAADLRAATVHWLRHTGISEDVKHRPREHVRDDAGHASMATTDRYIDSDLRERHQSGKRKRIKEL